ncbi:MAG TPA: cyanophycin synthetase [Solirubrobacterales bacterium]|nr:cyanophycin synthetase [Solirubrobacterales bacterium]
MRALCAALGDPQLEYRTLHVVGTNGKGSVALACEAILESTGLRTGVCVSPHLWEWRERTRIGGGMIGRAEFEAAVADVAVAVRELERSWADDERVTQFEAAVAASFVAFRDAGVDAAVIEAGLGGRLDATNVISSTATALTSVALDHTEWLGESAEEIAGEKLAVLEPGTTLVTGRLEPEIARLAAEHADQLDAELRVAGELPEGAGGEDLVPYMRRNAAVAHELASVVAKPSLKQVHAALAGLGIRGRAELIDGRPPIIADAAHNTEGAEALAEALEQIAPGRPRVACIALLSDKDADGIAAALAPALDRVVCSEARPGPAMGRPGAEPMPAATLAERFARFGVEAEAVGDPLMALDRARRLALDLDGVAICAGSHYLLRHLWTGKRDQSSST